VIGGDADVSGSGLDHLQHSMQHTDHGTEGPIRAFSEAAKAVEVAEKLVRAVYEMNDHGKRCFLALPRLELLTPEARAPSESASLVHLPNL
jgi:hypothetical protein